MRAGRAVLLLFLVHQVCPLPVLPDGTILLRAAPSESQQETLESLYNSQEQPGGDLSIRDKRTINIIRQFFPGLADILDRTIKRITSFLFRTVGRVVFGLLRSPGASSDSQSSSSSAPTPSYISPSSSSDSSFNSDGGSPFPDLPSSSSSSSSDSSTDSNAGGEFSGNSDSGYSAYSNEAESAGGLEGAGSENHPVAVPYGPNPEADTGVGANIDDADRDKRFLWGDSSSDANSNGGSSGGGFFSGILRAFTGGSSDENAEGGEGGSGGDGSSSEGGSSYGPGGGDNGHTGGEDLSTDHYPPAIPGPITRLFTIINRGISNLVGDLIVRLAATGERLITFKARLINSLI